MRYYRAQNTGAGWTGATAALIIPIIGLIPAVACSSTPPKDFNLNYPESDLMDNSDYASGYRYEAHRIKRKYGQALPWARLFGQLLYFQRIIKFIEPMDLA